MSRIVLAVIGTILILSAGAKLWLLVSDPFADLKTGYPLLVLWLAVAAEASVGLLGILRSGDDLSWFANVVLFGVLFAVSTSRMALGFPSCNCFGEIQLPVWFTPIMNCLVLTILFTVKTIPGNRPHTRLGEFMQSSSAKLREPRYAGSALALLAFVALVFWNGWNGQANSLDLTKVFGRSVFPDKRILVDNLVLNQLKDVKISLYNGSARDCQIVGGVVSCECVARVDGENTIASGKSIELLLRVKPTSHGAWHQRVVYYLSHPQQSRFVVDLVGGVSHLIEGE